MKAMFGYNVTVLCKEKFPLNNLYCRRDPLTRILVWEDTCLQSSDIFHQMACISELAIMDMLFSYYMN
jgi:hypothetical protein